MEASTVFALLFLISAAHSGSSDKSCYSYDKAVDDALDTVCTKYCMRRPVDVVDSYVTSSSTRQVLRSFSQSSCGSGVVEINKLQIGPDPISLPGSINLAFNVDVKQELQSPIQVQVTVWKKILFWIDVWELSYNDVCSLIQDRQCPQAFIDNNIPCKCPVSAGNYYLPTSNFPLQVPSIPSGDYCARFDVKMGSTPVLCEDVYFTIA